MDVITMWWISLGVAVAVVLVVAGLLVWIAMAAKSIDKHAERIWIAGKAIAANTVQLWQLQPIASAAGELLSATRELNSSVRAEGEGVS